MRFRNKNRGIKHASERELLEQVLSELREIRHEMERIKQEAVPVPIVPFYPTPYPYPYPYPPDATPGNPWYTVGPGPHITWCRQTNTAIGKFT